jgi:hypothetical protein
MKMSLEELKIEYYSCDNKNVAQKDMIKQIARKKKLAKQMAKEEKEKNDINSSINTILKSQHSHKPDETFVKKRGSMERVWESHKTRFGNLEPQYREEVENDFTNNKLMERLNCEVDFRINGKVKKEILKPYDDKEDYDSEEESYTNSARRLIH